MAYGYRYLGAPCSPARSFTKLVSLAWLYFTSSSAARDRATPTILNIGSYHIMMPCLVACFGSRGRAVRRESLWLEMFSLFLFLCPHSSMVLREVLGVAGLGWALLLGLSHASTLLLSSQLSGPEIGQIWEFEENRHETCTIL